MAITFDDGMRREIEYLRDRVRHARSRDEHEHYSRELRRLEEDFNYRHRMNMYDLQSPMIPMPGLKTEVPKTEAPKKDELSFLGSADKKLLLIGEMA